MEYISSDTNVWVDFAVIGQLALPFKLPYIYIMDENAIEDELLSPEGLSSNLLQLGLQATELSEEEYWLAEQLNAKYAKPSLYDCVALAIAKSRNIVLLSGDGPLRKAAKAEGVTVMGTIGILDQLLAENHIDTSLYLSCLRSFQQYNNGKIRLPAAALQERIDRYK